MKHAVDERWMGEALALAARGLSTTHPNPRVGCVIVSAAGEVVGRGWHQRAGEAHAEILALSEAGSLARGATAYVTLEPCAHQGRTGPCSRALIDAELSRVVVAHPDPYREVNGRGVQALRDAGIQVSEGVCAEEAALLNCGFFKRVRTGRPWVRVKLAASLDGRTALSNGESKWITDAEARADVQHWRARASAVLSGIGTVRADDPNLDVRIESERQPLRVILDSQFSMSAQSQLLSTGGKVLWVGTDRAEPPQWTRAHSMIECLQVPQRGARPDLGALLDELGARQHNEVHVEAGPTLSGALVEAGLVDELLLYVAPRILGPGRDLLALPALEKLEHSYNFEWHSHTRVGNALRLRCLACSPD